jgi:hypothetical protein
MTKYFVPLFKAESSFVVVACGAGMTENIRAGFQEFGYTTEIRELPGTVETDGSDEDPEL